MWKPSLEEKQTSANSPSQPSLAPLGAPTNGSRPAEPPKKLEAFRAEVTARIGKSVQVKGAISANEDLYVDGEVEGSIDLPNNTVVIGPNGRVKAEVHARQVIVHGNVEGNVSGGERVELKNSANLSGNITSRRIVIEDGAFLKGSVNPQQDSQEEPRLAMLTAAGTGALSGSLSTN